MRRFRTALLAGLLSLAATVAAAAQDPTAAQNVVRITAADGARGIFGGLVDDAVARSMPGMQYDVRFSSSITALREFCHEARGSSPDIVLTTWRMRSALAYECMQNRINDVSEVELGRVTLVLAVRSESQLSAVTSAEVYQALARDVPYRGEFQRNASVRWSDIDHDLPQQDIRFQLPPHDDSWRASFDTMVLEAGCRDDPLIKGIVSARQRTARCVTTRFDRVREIPREQSAKALLDAPEGTVGVLSYTDVARSGGKLRGLVLDGVAPTAEAVINRTYDIGGSYWLYAKHPAGAANAKVAAEIDRIVARSRSEAVIGPDGLLAKLGLIPLPEEDRAAQRDVAGESSEPLGLGTVLTWTTAALSNAWSLFGLRYSADAIATPGEATDFTKLMDIAGYNLKEVSSAVGLIPEVGMTFGMTREMSEADQEYLSRALRRDAVQRPGAWAAIQRRIVRAILDRSEAGDYRVNTVEISFLPLPMVRLVVVPAGGSE